MCGLVGCIGDITGTEEEVFRNMLVFDTLRGPHSTGMLAIDGKHTPSIVKTVGDPFQLFDTAAFAKVMKQKNICLIGHNRFATTGQINRKNAHPFECSHIIGAHNGTLTNKYSLKNGSQFDVDSEALYDHIAIDGLKSALSIARGAYALTYYDKEDKTFNMVRNKERPLFYAFNEKKTTLFWASEKWMLSVALSRSSIKYEDIVELPILSLMTFPVSTDNKELTPVITEITDLPKEVESRVKPFHYGVGGAFNQQHSKVNKVMLNKEFDRIFFNAEHSLRVGIITKDKDDSLYVNLFDDLHPLYEIRYYFTERNKLFERIGDLIHANIGAASRNSDGVFIYRIDESSIKYTKKEHNQLTDEAGNVYTRDEFNKEFHDCIWCSSPLMFDDENRLVSKGIGVCPSCTDNTELSQYL